MPDNSAPDYYIGLMSGTSLDGVDAVLVDFSAASPKLIASHLQPFPQALKTRLKKTLQPGWTGSFIEFGELHHQLGTLFAEAANQLIDDAEISADVVKAIGSHGQTVWHHPHGNFPFSLQLGDPSRITELTGITTVADFRSRDVAAGGEGAPLLPAFLKSVLDNTGKNQLILNIGGIANLTAIDKRGNVTGFDTGPGNGLLDAWIKTNKNKSFDEQGAWAASGTILEDPLQQLLDDPYFSLPVPKSTGKEYFNLGWLEARWDGKTGQFAAQDVQATLAELTARSVTNSIVHLMTASNTSSDHWSQLLVYGGGWKNQDLIRRIQLRLPQMNIQSTHIIGIEPDWMESIAFAWLAKRTLHGQSGNLPSVTGASGERILGAIYPR